MSLNVDNWNTWTVKSLMVPFKSSENSVGDGEQKLGAEFNVEPLGQNFTFDLEVNGERWEVKKLDSDNSFRLGVGIASHYTPIISNVISMFEKLINIKNDLLDCESGAHLKSIIYEIESNNGRSKTRLLDGLRKNEVSESNLDKANDIIEDLKKQIVTRGTISLYSSIDGIKKNYSILDGFKKIIIDEKQIEERIRILGDSNKYNNLLLTNLIYDNISFFNHYTFREILNKIIREVFQNVKLVLVHEDKGFKIISNMDSIYCNRITSGSPRCKLK